MLAKLILTQFTQHTCASGNIVAQVKKSYFLLNKYLSAHISEILGLAHQEGAGVNLKLNRDGGRQQ